MGSVCSLNISDEKVIRGYLAELNSDEKGDVGNNIEIQTKWAERLRKAGLTVIKANGELAALVTVDGIQQTMSILVAARATIETALSMIEDPEKRS